MASYSDFRGDLNKLLVEGSPTLEELEIQAFGICVEFTRHTRHWSTDQLNPGRRVTGDLDGVLTQRSALPRYPESYPHQIDFNSDPDRTYGFTTPRSHPSLFTSRPPLTPAPDPQLLESPQPTTRPISPIVEIPAEPPIPAVPYVMELHVVTKMKGKTGRGKAAEEFRAKKPPINLSLHQTYVQFLTSVAKVADVKQSQLDREHMRWKHQKPATSPPVSVSDEESFSIMIQAIRSKKVDRWIIVEMGKPLVSDAMSSILLNSSCLIKLKVAFSHGPCRETTLWMMTTTTMKTLERFVLEPTLKLLLIFLRFRLISESRRLSKGSKGSTHSDTAQPTQKTTVFRNPGARTIGFLTATSWWLGPVQL